MVVPHQVVVADGLAFVKAAAASAAAAPAVHRVAQPDSTPPAVAGESTAEPVDSTPATATAAAGDAAGDEVVRVPPPPPQDDQTRWGEAFGPPYSAIFLDVDSKDTSVGMSCPPAAFLEPAFLSSLKTLLRGGGGSGGAPGVLAINVAARSRGLFNGAIQAVCTVFTGGEVSGGVVTCELPSSLHRVLEHCFRRRCGYGG